MGRLISRVGYRLIKLAVVHTAEGTRLKDNAGNGVGKGGVFDPIEDDGAYSHLTGIRLTPSFGRDHTGQQGKVAISFLSPGRAGLALQTECLQSGRTTDSVCGQTVGPLEVFYGIHRGSAVYAVHRAVIIAPAAQLVLDD